MTTKHANFDNPIAYDFHGNLPISFPFQNLKPTDIDIYMDVDTFTGKETCGQRCKNCWFVNNTKVLQKRFPIVEGQKIVFDLRNSGYNVSPRYTDTFAYNGEFIICYGASNVRSYAQKEDMKATQTMEKGEAWTSGSPLLNGDSNYLLTLAKKYNYGTISISFHGLLNENLDIESENLYPIKGVFHGSKFKQVTDRIKQFNNTNKDDRFPGFRINVGITLGKHNMNYSMLLRYFEYFNNIGISTLRFNRFFDHGKVHPHLELTEDDIVQLYQNIQKLHSEYPINFQLNMSGDLGSSGAKLMHFPENIIDCKGGKQLFALIPTEPKRLDSTLGTLEFVVGELTACVNLFEPVMGEVILMVKNSASHYYIKWNHSAIEKLQKYRTSNIIHNGCFSRELNILINEKKY